MLAFNSGLVKKETAMELQQIDNELKTFANAIQIFSLFYDNRYLLFDCCNSSSFSSFTSLSPPSNRTFSFKASFSDSTTSNILLYSLASPLASCSAYSKTISSVRRKKKEKEITLSVNCFSKVHFSILFLSECFKSSM